jgi:hypothetical protein
MREKHTVSKLITLNVYKDQDIAIDNKDVAVISDITLSGKEDEMGRMSTDTAPPVVKDRDVFSLWYRYTTITNLHGSDKIQTLRGNTIRR